MFEGRAGHDCVLQRMGDGTIGAVEILFVGGSHGVSTT